MPEKIATSLALQAGLGAMHLLLKTKIDAQALQQKVTSKGGTTSAALKIFEKNKFSRIISQALRAAHLRCLSLSRQPN